MCGKFLEKKSRTIIDHVEINLLICNNDKVKKQVQLSAEEHFL